MKLSVYSLVFGWIVIADDVRDVTQGRSLAYDYYRSQHPIQAKRGGSFVPFVLRSGDWSVMVEAYDRPTGRETYVSKA